MKKKPTPKARELFAKLSALAERGIDGEQAAAIKKLDRLKAKYDFTEPPPVADIFNDVKITRAPYSSPVCEVADIAVASNVKWALESATGISCRLSGNQILAEVTPGSAKTLAGAARTIAAGFCDLWQRFSQQPGIYSGDRVCFNLGLFDGMMNEPRAIGQPLPSRGTPPKVNRKSKAAPGISIHPYTVAVNLGKQIRFSVPMDDVKNQLDRIIKGEIAA